MAETGSAAGSALGDLFIKVTMFAVDVFAILFVLAGVVAALGSIFFMLCDAHEKDRLGVLAFALTIGILVGYMSMYGLF